MSPALTPAEARVVAEERIGLGHLIQEYRPETELIHLMPRACEATTVSCKGRHAKAT